MAQKIYFEEIDKEETEDFNIVYYKITTSNKILDAIQFYNLTQECSGTGIFLIQGNERSLGIKIPKEILNFKVFVEDRIEAWTIRNYIAIFE